ncbi:MAG: Hsp20/alpha crystallin family protein [Bacteroidetes bacterium]|nr:Hsp20/alpha crystallin family protein [Bacteroidota bacterium]
MPHYKFDPMKELEFLSQRMRKFADEFPETFSFEFGKGFEPKLDVIVDENEIRLIAELPGVAKEDLNLTYTDGVLTLSGEKKEPQLAEQASILRSERSFGMFKREIPLSKDIDANSLTASMNDGLLTVVMKIKRDAARQERSISIS